MEDENTKVVEEKTTTEVTTPDPEAKREELRTETEPQVTETTTTVRTEGE